MKNDILALINERMDYYVHLYQHLHSHPELSTLERETSTRMALELSKIGYEVHTDVGRFGVVGMLRNGDGPLIMVRTDTDALPIEEKTGLPYASTRKATDIDGSEVCVMHACGHDMHMTIFIGVAQNLYRLRNAWNGTIMLVAQPAEERALGARDMIKHGLFEKFGVPRAALGLHVSASLPAGMAAYNYGAAMANVDNIDVTVFGKGGHGAYPHQTTDPIVLSAQMINAWQSIVSREISPSESAVVTVGSIHGGTKHNIIPDSVHMQLTLRSFNDTVRNHIIAAVKRVAQGIAIAAGLPESKYPVFNHRNEYTPVLENDTQLTNMVRGELEKALGENNVLQYKPSLGGEDFAVYGKTEHRIPISFFWIGAVSNEKYHQSIATGESLPGLHSPFFAPDPIPTIQSGILCMTMSALKAFETM